MSLHLEHFSSIFQNIPVASSTSSTITSITPILHALLCPETTPGIPPPQRPPATTHQLKQNSSSARSHQIRQDFQQRFKFKPTTNTSQYFQWVNEDPCISRPTQPRLCVPRPKQNLPKNSSTLRNSVYRNELNEAIANIPM